MADWQVGDLALCIKRGAWRNSRTGRFCGNRGMRAGRVATVRWVGNSPNGILTLWFEGWPGNTFADGFGAIRFRKVTPPEADEFDHETIALLNGTPVPVEA